MSTCSLKRSLLKGVSLINEGSLKRGHKDGDERNGLGTETEEGGYSKMQETRVRLLVFA